MSTTTPEARHMKHPAEWWEQFGGLSEKFDVATVTEALGDEIIPRIESPLLRREAELAVETVLRYLNKPASQELEIRAAKATARLVATVARLDDRSTLDDAGTTEAYSVCHLLEGRWAEAASEVEPIIGTVPLVRAFVVALRLERFDAGLTLRLINAGQGPALAVESGLAIGKYAWWPGWLLRICTERALEGRLDAATILALDRCAFAELSPFQSRMARRLLNGEPGLIESAAGRLEGLGELVTAAKLREGDLTAVALAARLIPA
jgi:hypothetical protein